MSKKDRNEIYRIRYQIYRDLGYSPKEARRLRGRALNVSPIKTDKETKAVKKTKVYRKILGTMTGPKDVNKFKNKAWRVKNDTVFTRWGMLTHDDRYKEQTNKIVNFVKNDLKVNEDQAYFFVYYMTSNKLTYRQAKKELLSSEEFEMYKPKRKRGKR